MKLTGFVLLGGFVGIMGYDLWVVMHYGNYDYTVSQWVYQTAKEWTAFTFLAGFISGHFFWPIHNQGNKNNNQGDESNGKDEKDHKDQENH